MRILYHHRSLADGAEGIHIREMVSAFRDLGHEVRLIGLAAGPSNADAHALLPRLRRLLPEAAHELAGVIVNLIEYRSTVDAIKAFRPHLMYKRHARNDVAAISAAKAHGVPAVLEVNCLYSSPSYLRFEPLAFRRVSAALERRALMLATQVFTVSSPLADEARALGARSVTVLPNGANPVTFSPAAGDRLGVRQQLGLNDTLTLGWAGIIREWHGLDLLLGVLQRVPESQLLLIGDGPGRAALLDRAAAMGMAGRIIVTGRVPHEQMPRYLGALDLAIVPDERTGIASPMKLLEYMAMGLPVVAPDAPNIRDIVTPGIDGLLFRSGDPEELAATVTSAVGDPVLRARLGVNARTKIEAERNWRRIAQRILDLVAVKRRTERDADGSLKGQDV